MPYTLQDYHNYSKFMPQFFKNLVTLPGEIFQKYVISDILDEQDVPNNAVAAVWIWTRREDYPHVGRRCFMDSCGHRFKEAETPVEIAQRLDQWLADVRYRKEEFEAFMEGVAIEYRPLSISQIHHMARPE